MPRMPIYADVLITARLGPNDPPAGVTGRCVCHRNHPTRDNGIDFSRSLEHLDETSRASLNDLDDNLEQPTGRYLPDEVLRQISKHPLPDVEIGASTDYLVGQVVRFERDYPVESLRNHSGRIAGFDADRDGRPSLMFVQVTSWIEGDYCDAVLHQDARDGATVSSNDFDKVVIQAMGRLPPGIEVRALINGTRTDGTIVIPDGNSGRVTTQMYYLRLPGLAERGSDFFGMVPDMPDRVNEGFRLIRNDFSVLSNPTVARWLETIEAEPSHADKPLSRTSAEYTERMREHQARLERTANEIRARAQAEARPAAYAVEARTQVVLMADVVGPHRAGSVGRLYRSVLTTSTMVDVLMEGGTVIHVRGEDLAICPRMPLRDMLVRVVGNLPAGYNDIDNQCTGRVAEDGDSNRGTQNIGVQIDDASIQRMVASGRDVNLHRCNGALESYTGYFIPSNNLQIYYVPATVMPRLTRLRDYTGEAGTQAAAQGPAGPSGAQWFTTTGLPTDDERRPAWARPPQPLTAEMMERHLGISGGKKSMLSEDALGKFAQIVTRNDTVKALGLAVGTQGRIIMLRGDKYTVDFYPLTFPHGHDGHGRGMGENSCWDFDPRLLAIMDGPGDTVEYKKGDRVILIMGGGNMPPRDTEGVVLNTEGAQVDVDFYPYRWKGGRELPGGNPRSCARVMNYSLKKTEVGDIEALKPFYLIGVVDKKVTPLEGHPTFETGSEAEAYKKTIEGKYPYKIQVRKAAKPDTAWREREEARFKDGTYKPMPKGWDLKPITDHFLHLSVKHPGQVAFTPSQDYGEQDRQVQTRPGAYVQKFYPDLDNKQVARYSALATCEGGLEIVHDGKEMARIYRLGAQGLGPESCMKYDFVREGHGGPPTPIHPIECYGAGDIALAYLRQDGATVARCLIWPEKRIFTRAYGDLAKIIAVLEAEGYTRGDFIGARLRRVKFEHNGTTLWVCPYVDESNSVQGNPGAMGVVDDGEHLIITPPGEGQSTNQANGYIAIARQYRLKDNQGLVRCQHCAGMFDPDEMRDVIVGRGDDGTYVVQSWDRRCRDRHAYHCDGLRRLVAGEIRSYPDGETGGYISQYGYDERGAYTCAISERVYYNKPAMRLHDGRPVNVAQFKRHGFVCAGTGHNLLRRNPDTGHPNYIEIGSQLFSTAYAEAHPDEMKEKSEAYQKKVEAMRAAAKKQTIEGSIAYKPQYTSSSTTSYGINIGDLFSNNTDRTR